MLFSKLLPREADFFEMFNRHADRIVEASQAFSNLVQNYDNLSLREKYTLKVTCPGDPLLVAEGLLVLDDTWPDFMRGRWSIEKVTASGKREESYRCLIEARIGIETMDLAAACRTYNVLSSESRAVLAALLIEG